MLDSKKIRIGIIGLGYVGLPLAVEFGKIFDVCGFDLNKERIFQLNNYNDVNLELSEKEIRLAKCLFFSEDIKDLENCNFYIITVPTPVNEKKEPNLDFLTHATSIVAESLKKNDVVVYESTVYPGCTEEICVPILEKKSKLKFNSDFFCGYSPERINPGDKERKVKDIIKVVSGSNISTLKFIAQLYSKIITAGIFQAESIKIAEASKLIENTQRDVNIGLINELAVILNKLDINTSKVLEAANTKWNFLDFKPGLVGGHCIGVDSYYLINKSQQNNITPEIVKSARHINENMGNYVAKSFLKQLPMRSDFTNKVLICGYTFKENCADIRNTKVRDIANYLVKNKIMVSIYDPWLTKKNIQELKNFDVLEEFPNSLFNGIIIAVAHKKFKEIGLEKIKSLTVPNSPIYDVKSLFLSSEEDGITYL
jgi:UDP-N-acetyl-D-glucosamine/UDP-N-acetyl-D-galactosamine dehydrogenase